HIMQAAASTANWRWPLPSMPQTSDFCRLVFQCSEAVLLRIHSYCRNRRSIRRLFLNALKRVVRYLLQVVVYVVENIAEGFAHRVIQEGPKHGARPISHPDQDAAFVFARFRTDLYLLLSAG